MNKNSVFFVWILLALLAMAMTACSPQSNAVDIVTPSPTATTAPVQETYSDPFAYCTAVGTVDKPDARYTGPQINEQIINGFKQRQAWKPALSRWICS